MSDWITCGATVNSAVEERCWGTECYLAEVTDHERTRAEGHVAREIPDSHSSNNSTGTHAPSLVHPTSLSYTVGGVF